MTGRYCGHVRLSHNETVPTFKTYDLQLDYTAPLAENVEKVVNVWQQQK